MSRFQEQATRWAKQVEALAASRFYADEARARKFVGRHVYPAWLAMNEAPTIEHVFGRRGVTTPQLLIVHLFARGVLGVGLDEEDAPRIVAWRPSRTRGMGGAPVCHRVIATRDVARIIGRSQAAVRRALRRFKGLEGVRPRYGTWSVISMPTGVALDGTLSTATRHPYMYAGHEYADAQAYAKACKTSHRRFTARQALWCDGAMLAAGLPLKRPSRRATQAVAQYF